jgi:hypothetical protein
MSSGLSSAQVKYNRQRRHNGFTHYFNSQEDIYINEDPRLGSLPPGWGGIERRRNPNDPYIFDRFKNNVTGDVINSDPRMLPDILRARGVKLNSFLLV